MGEKLIDYRFKNIEEYKDFLDKEPNETWIQLRDLGPGKVQKFIPIFIQQANADFIFRSWNVIEEKLMEISNGIACTVKILATPDYPGAEEIILTGSTATQYKTKAKNHIEFDVPNARSRAIGIAFGTLGNLFGRSLNRTYKVIKNGKPVTVHINHNLSFRKK